MLRFFWLFNNYHTAYDLRMDNFVWKLQLYFVLAAFAEAIRRTQWAIYRVENEFYNNFEAYRSIPAIPGI